MENEKNKLLSIIIPCFNSQKYILKALKKIYSIDEKLLEKIEVLLIDDGSSLEFKKYLDEIKEEKFTYKYFYKSNGNWGSVINFVKNNQLATGKYITILDSDDWYIPKNFSTFLNKLSTIDENLIVTKFYICKKIIINRKNEELDVLKNTTIFFRTKTKKITQYQSLTPFSMPIGKFYHRSLFYQLKDLKENIVFQDMLLFIDAISRVENVLFYNIKIGVWNLTNETSSTNIPWDEKKLTILYNNLKSIELYDNKHFNGYSLMYWMLLIKKNLNKINLKFNLTKNNVKICWIPKMFQKVSILICFYVINKNMKKNNILINKNEK